MQENFVPLSGTARRIRSHKQARFHICDVPIKVKNQFDLFDNKVRFLIVFAADHLRLFRHLGVLFSLGCAVLERIV